MSFEQALNFVPVFVLVSFRLAGMMLFAPLFGSGRIPRRLKLMMALVLAMSMCGAIDVHVTLPKIRWGLLYGVILCNARAMGEFGAVSVVSGHVRGQTNTMPLHVEILYNEYHFIGAFAVASLLTLLALLTIGLKTAVEWLAHRRQVEREPESRTLSTARDATT